MCKSKKRGFTVDYQSKILQREFSKIVKACPHVDFQPEAIIVPEKFDILKFYKDNQVTNKAL